jgi:hypothetical protein
VEEFFRQGDDEEARGMPISPFMDRINENTFKNQSGFLNYVVRTGCKYMRREERKRKREERERTLFAFLAHDTLSLTYLLLPSLLASFLSSFLPSYLLLLGAPVLQDLLRLHS